MDSLIKGGSVRGVVELGDKSVEYEYLSFDVDPLTSETAGKSITP